MKKDRKKRKFMAKGYRKKSGRTKGLERKERKPIKIFLTFYFLLFFEDLVFFNF
jgi:hypothetical protein